MAIKIDYRFDENNYVVRRLAFRKHASVSVA